MRIHTTFLVISILFATGNAAARNNGCDDKSLSLDKRWNGATTYSTPELDHFYKLIHELRVAYEGPDRSKARAVAEDYLKSAKEFPCNWNYGNAIHNANTVLGLLALRDGKRGDAVKFLRAAGESAGSPQLDSFGPSLLLARDLARAGEYDAVVGYLLSVKKFWKATDDSLLGMLFPFLSDSDPVGTWIKQLQDNQVPAFSAFNMHPP
ncbi:MAG: hypothetical protein ACR2GP_04210 [Burkholderiaceae bacterium]